jgi:hypothetical protein
MNEINLNKAQVNKYYFIGIFSFLVFNEIKFEHAILLTTKDK